MQFNNSLINNIKSEDIKAEPFPHIIINNVLDKKYYDTLDREFPEDKLFTKNKKYLENYRYNIFNYNYDSISDLWKQFIDYHSSEYFCNKLVDLFHQNIIHHYPDFIKEYEKKNYTLGNSQKDFKEKKIDMCISSDIAINTPLSKQINTVRSPHLDNSKKILTGLFYMRHKKDNSKGGDLEIFKFKNKFKKKYFGNSVPYKFVDVVETIPYKENTMIIFLNSPDSIHGVTNRKPTDFSRRFIYFSLSKQNFAAYDTSSNQINLFDQFLLRVKRKLNTLLK